jgi:hypothetical protein
LGNQQPVGLTFNLNSSVDNDENREYKEKQELAEHYAFTRWMNLVQKT